MTCAALALGCGPAVDVSGTDSSADTEPPGSSEGGGPSTPPTPDTTGGPLPPSTSTVTTLPPTATDPTVDPDSSSGFGSSEGSSGFASSSSGDGLPDGSACEGDFDCASGRCFVIPVLGGWCGECSSDADCALGCNPPNPLQVPATPSVCGSGGVADACESQAACQDGLQCVPLVEQPGVLELSGCSECSSDNDCTPGSVCAKNLDLTTFSGAWTCVVQGALPLGAVCDDLGGGDQACGSGACAMTNVGGVVPIGVCSECDESTACGLGQTCSMVEVGLDGSTFPATCE